MKWGEQARVLRLIPGLEQAEFVRFGMIHRNTYINGPTVLRETWQFAAATTCSSRGRFPVWRATSSRRRRASSPGRNAAALVLGEPLRVPPRTTAIGALAYYVSHAEPKHYQPTNITFGIMPPLSEGRPDARRRGARKLKKADRKLAHSERALADLDWSAGWTNWFFLKPASGVEGRAARSNQRNRRSSG
jgi:methylenetetrahydrofolate--tRNA-(uracil-5-)-methyltransferase